MAEGGRIEPGRHAGQAVSETAETRRLVEDGGYAGRHSAPGPRRDEPGTMQNYQWRLIGLAHGIQPEDLAPMLAVCSEILGRVITARGQLSYLDARAVAEGMRP